MSIYVYAYLQKINYFLLNQKDKRERKRKREREREREEERDREKDNLLHKHLYIRYIDIKITLINKRRCL